MDMLLVPFMVFVATFLILGSLYTITKEFARQYKEKFTDSASSNLADLFLFIDAKKLFVVNLLTIIIVFIVGWGITYNVYFALVLALVFGFSPPFIYKQLKKRRQEMFAQQLPDALLMIYNAMLSGSSLINALEALVSDAPSPTNQEFEMLLKEQRLGLDFEEALDNMHKRMPLDEILLFISAVKISREIGGNLAEVLQRVSETMRQKQQMEGKIRSLTAQGRLQGIFMTALPIVIGIVLYVMEPTHMMRLFTEPLGWGVLLCAFIMLNLGYLFIRKIVNIDV